MAKLHPTENWMDDDGTCVHLKTSLCDDGTINCLHIIINDKGDTIIFAADILDVHSLAASLTAWVEMARGEKK